MTLTKKARVLTVIEATAAESAMANFIGQSKTFTFSQLWPIASRAAGTTMDHDDPCYRLADRFLQRMRKAGRIELDPANKRRWRITESGRKALTGDLVEESV